MKITAHTDGAASGNPGPAGWAWAFNDQHAGGYFPSATNNQMELYAVIDLLSAVPYGAEVEVVTDSKLVVGWLSQGWRAQNPTNRTLIEWFRAIVETKELRVSFTRVKGHADNAENNRVDRLARDWAALARSRR